jgi:hypothetical protein
MAKGRRYFEKPVVDEAYLMNILSGDEPLPSKNACSARYDVPKDVKPVERPKSRSAKKLDYQETFLVNSFPLGRNGIVVHIREEYHERLFRIVQLTREDITAYFNDKFIIFLPFVKN